MVSHPPSCHGLIPRLLLGRGLSGSDCVAVSAELVFDLVHHRSSMRFIGDARHQIPRAVEVQSAVGAESVPGTYLPRQGRRRLARAAPGSVRCVPSREQP